MLDNDEIRSFRWFLNSANERELREKKAALRGIYDSAEDRTEVWYDARFMLKLLAEEEQVRSDIRRLEQDRQRRKQAGG